MFCFWSSKIKGFNTVIPSIIFYCWEKVATLTSCVLDYLSFYLCVVWKKPSSINIGLEKKHLFLILKLKHYDYVQGGLHSCALTFYFTFIFIPGKFLFDRYYSGKKYLLLDVFLLGVQGGWWYITKYIVVSRLFSWILKDICNSIYPIVDLQYNWNMLDFDIVRWNKK